VCISLSAYLPFPFFCLALSFLLSLTFFPSHSPFLLSLFLSLSVCVASFHHFSPSFSVHWKGSDAHPVGSLGFFKAFFY
jgi:hypothetical protein